MNTERPSDREAESRAAADRAQSEHHPRGTIIVPKFAKNRYNQLFALSVLPPAIFLLTGHMWLGLLFIACVVGGRFSRQRSSAGRDRK